MEARVQVHSTFTVPKPVPLFVVAVEVVDGEISAGMFLRVPLNPMLDFTVRIADVGPINNSWGLSLVGLVLRCDDESSRQLVDVMNIGDELLAVTHDGED
ncbi:MAG: hypothetical protein ACYTGL_22830 [Planctomycetota bacterium]|jgi:hypothetical protein